MLDVSAKPRLDEAAAVEIANTIFEISVSARELPSERDQNFLLVGPEDVQYILKVANENEQFDTLEFQNSVLNRVQNRAPWLPCPRLLLSSSNQPISLYRSGESDCWVRLLTYLDGRPMGDSPGKVAEVATNLGRFLGQLDAVLAGVHHESAYRSFPWNIKNARQVIDLNEKYLDDTVKRGLVAHFLSRFEMNVIPHLHSLRSSLIHNDANDNNILIREREGGGTEITGILDFGDMVHGPVVYEPAVAAAYAMLNQQEPLSIASRILAGYHQTFPLLEEEVHLFFDLVTTRLVTSVVLAAVQRSEAPENEYLSISEADAWQTLEKLLEVDPHLATKEFLSTCGYRPSPTRDRWSKTKLIQLRSQYLGPSLSTSYMEPLKIVRGYRQHLFDESGRKYLDMVNNVAHVGHCHPMVVRAGQQQMSALNTNTRYLHDDIIHYSQRLTEMLPSPLSVCYFVCSGSEANELALRLARAHTNKRGILVVDGAYHGNSGSLVDISPYKYKGPGGSGPPDYVFEVPLPDTFRGLHRSDDALASEKYSRYVKIVLDEADARGLPVGAFIVESYPGCAGQICFPDGYLRSAFQYVHASGGVCIVDEVQVGFGRIGDHFWGFEAHGVEPDIVTMGKPMGNGHPFAAVVTTQEIAQSFANGMEYFNTYGGNPVSCAIGLAVLDVIEEESLQANARTVGGRLKEMLLNLKLEHSLIGDVRGEGLFLGIELVSDREFLSPAADHAKEVVERMKDSQILLSTDGPDNNVIKIKPPLVIDHSDAEQMVKTLSDILSDLYR